MLHGLYMLTFDDDKKIDSYEEIEAESDLPDSADERDVYYFGDSPKEGVMAVSYTHLDVYKRQLPMVLHEALRFPAP